MPKLARALAALAALVLAAASPPGDTAPAPTVPAPAAPAPAAAPPAAAAPETPAPAPAGPRSDVPSVTDSAALPPAAPEAGAPAAKPHPARHASHVHRRAPPPAAAAAAAAGTDATVALTTQPGSELETTATRLVASDLKQSRSAGDPPVMLVGSARLSVKPGPAALFVQVQSADFCGSAGCSTSAYLRNGDNWTKVLDSISGPIKVSRRSHHGMYDLLVHGRDRWVWNGTAYADTLPSPDVDLLHSVKK